MIAGLAATILAGAIIGDLASASGHYTYWLLANPFAYVTYAAIVTLICAVWVPRLQPGHAGRVLLADSREICEKSTERGLQREWLKVIFGKFKGCNNVQAQVLVGLYINRWMRVTGVITEVDKPGTEMQIMLRVGSRHPNVCLKFSDSARFNGLATLRHGTRITAVGKIDVIKSHLITCIDSSIVHYG